MTDSPCSRRCEPSRVLPKFRSIFLTALDDRSSTRRGMNLGADDYLPKPFPETS